LIYKPDLRSALYSGLYHHFLQPGAGGEIFGALGCWEVVPNGHIIGIVDRLKNGEGSNTQGFSLGVKIIILQSATPCRRNIRVMSRLLSDISRNDMRAY
jgi:hypothetical protein